MKNRQLHKNPAALLLFVCIFAVYPLQAQVPQIAVPIEQITAYPDRAKVMRSAVMPVARGKSKLVFKGPAMTLDPDSLAGFCDAEGCFVQSIFTRTERTITSNHPRVAEIENKLKELKIRRDSALREKIRIEKQGSLLVEFRKLLTGEVSVPGRTENTSYSEIWNFIKSNRNSHNNLIEENRRKTQKLSREIESLEKELAVLKSSLDQNIRIIELSLYSPKRQTTRIGFSYVVKNAGWSVSYAATALTDGNIKLEYFANIRQKTGEPWKNVKIALSTTEPALGGERPRLKPLGVGVTAALSQGVIQGNQAQAVENLREESPEEKTDERAYRFNLPEKITMVSADRTRKTRLAELKLKPESSGYRVVAQLDSSPYSVYTLKSKAKFPLLQGRVYVYEKSGLTGQSEIQYTAPGKSFLLVAGRRDDLQIKRSRYKREESAGLIGGSKKYITEIVLEIKNEKTEAADVEVLERVPVSETEDVKIEIDPSTTKGAEPIRSGSGILRWKLNIQPGQTKTIRLKYGITVSSDVRGPFYGD